MSANEKITRLQNLLVRVQTRGAQPREARTNGATAAFSAPVAQVAYVAPAAPEVAEPTFDAPAFAEPDLEMMPAATAEVSSSPPPPTVDYDVESDMEVEVSSEEVEVDIDIDEPMALESGAQPVGQQTMPPGEMEEELEPLVAAPLEEPAAELEEVVDEPPPANEIEEPSPSSSRRPIASEEPTAEAYSEESAPRHTPPPESGKQVAAAPSNPPSRNPSMPPPSLEGHTLIGGWREPGLGPHIGPSTGAPVRVPGPGPSGTEPPVHIAPAAVAAAQPSGTRLSPDVTRPNLPARANVASFQGVAPVAKPQTLGELLDLTLGL